MPKTTFDPHSTRDLELLGATIAAQLLAGNERAYLEGFKIVRRGKPVIVAKVYRPK